jgi:hypothetical protein
MLSSTSVGNKQDLVLETSNNIENKNKDAFPAGKRRT